jgi:hypothetical protein
MLKPCKTLDEFVRKYDKDLERILCKSFRKYINIEDLPEVKNDVYAHLLEKKFFQTYDPSKAKFSTYLYTYLFKFLKSKKVKNDKDPTTYATCIDAPIFDDSDASLIDVKDFSNSDQTHSDVFSDLQLEYKIKELFKNKNSFCVNNPYSVGTLEHHAWNFLLEPRKIEDVEAYVSSHFSNDLENPYHPKKDEIKHIVWNSFWKKWQIHVPVSVETQNWINVAGVRKVIIDLKLLSEEERKIYDLVHHTKNTTYMEIVSQGFNAKVLNDLIEKGYLLEVIREKKKGNYSYFSVAKNSYLSFNHARNIAWYMVHLMRENHPEFIEFSNGRYHLNTKSDVTYKVLQMILNGKTKKQITTTLSISSAVLNEARESMFKDIRKIIDL